MGRITVQGESRDVSLLTISAEPKPVICNTLLHVSWKRKIVTESRLAICQIHDNFAEKESRNPKDDTESKPSGFSKKKKYNRE